MTNINYLGAFSSIAALWEAFPEGGIEGDFAMVGGSSWYGWDKYARQWAATDAPEEIPEEPASTPQEEPEEPDWADGSTGFEDVNYLGEFASLAEAWEAIPEGGQIGDTISIGGTLYGWNATVRNWTVSTATASALSLTPLGAANSVDINYLGTFASIDDVWAFYPEGGNRGDYVVVDATVYSWDPLERQWVESDNTVITIEYLAASPSTSTRINYLGAFDTLQDAWTAFPEGGYEGDYIHLDEVIQLWNKYSRNWGDTDDPQTPAITGQTIDGSLTVNYHLTVGGTLRAENLVVTNAPFYTKAETAAQIETAINALHALTLKVGNATAGSYTPTADSVITITKAQIKDTLGISDWALEPTAPETTLTAQAIVQALGTTPVLRAVADADGNSIAATYARKNEVADLFEVVDLANAAKKVQLKSDYAFFGPRKGVIFDVTPEADYSSSPADLMVREIVSGNTARRVLYSPLPLITGGDQILIDGTPGGGGGGGGMGYLYELLDVAETAEPSSQKILAYDPTARAWKYVDMPTGTITSVALSGGTNNGTLKLTVNGVVTDNIGVTGLNSMAYASTSDYVPVTRTVNNKALSTDITLNLDDIGDGSTRKLFFQQNASLAALAELKSSYDYIGTKKGLVFEPHAYADGADSNVHLYVRKDANNNSYLYSPLPLITGGDQVLISGTPGGSGTSYPYLHELQDVTITNIAAGQMLQWNGSAWVNIATPAGSVTQINVGSTAYTPSGGVVSLPAYPTSLPASDVYSWAKAASKPSYDYSEISNTPSSLPASDVHSWAKAATKPSYTLDEVSDGSTRSLANYVAKAGDVMTGDLEIRKDNAVLLLRTGISGEWPHYYFKVQANYSYQDTVDLVAGDYGGNFLSVAYTKVASMYPGGSGKVGINVSLSDVNNASYALYVGGAFHTTGDQTLASDETLKTNLKDLPHTVDDIAKAPAVSFDWKDGHGHSFGSIAQYWLPVCPEMVHGDEGNYSLAYAQGAFVNVIKVAQEVVELRKQVAELKNMIGGM